ncbi:MAG: hypothetical protein MUF49_15835 [Oculatellaceae cyanobacterium Prado106]|nr:hypothetical protein [Oculatellaceae cyanobacterium Prado106]
MRLVLGRMAIASLTFLAGCSVPMISGVTDPDFQREIQIQQTWQLQPGNRVADRLVLAGLGDISLELNGQAAAPFTGKAEINSQGCVLFTGADVPAYLFRLCGLERPRLGHLKQGEAIGSGKILHVATLRKQPDGSWTIVEPDQELLMRLLPKP